MGCWVPKFTTFVRSISVMKTGSGEVNHSRLLSVVWDPEGLQPPETHGHPGEADAEDNQVLAATEGHPEAHGHWRLETQSRPDGKYSCRLKFSTLRTYLEERPIPLSDFVKILCCFLFTEVTRDTSL